MPIRHGQATVVIAVPRSRLKLGPALLASCVRLFSSITYASSVGISGNATVPVSPVNLQIKAKLPAKSTGRLLDARADIIRPFTERRGLRADQIRLQREEVAIQVAELAKKRIEAERIATHPIPTKGLV